MKRLILAITSAMLLAVSVSPVAGASVNDFYFQSLHAEYYLGADAEGRSTLKTTETLVAVFPDFNQNHGIERALPKNYDDHPTSLKIESITDEKGEPRTYTTYEQNGNEVIRIGDKDTYVTGEQTYVVTYSQRDVTRYFEDTQSDEFYWDINGTAWQQPFKKVSAVVHLSDSLAPTFNKQIACYQGLEGATDTCNISQDGKTVTASAEDLAPGENMTIAVGFTLGTFRSYEPSLWDRIVSMWLYSLIVTSIIGLIGIIVIAYRYTKLSNRSRELEPIPTEYIPPKDTSVLTSSQIGDGATSSTTAQIIDFAVRHYVTISQTKEKSIWHKAEYELEIIKPVDDLLQEEKDFIDIIFGSTKIGTRLETRSLKNNYALYSKLTRHTTKLVGLVKGAYELRAKNKNVSKKFYTAGKVFLVGSLATVSPLLFIAAIVAFACGAAIRPLTDKGLELRRYLAGLKNYIELAERDRIRLLQSPEGAEKVGVKIKNSHDKKIVKLYERVLPYAVLFGQEKEWNKQLAIHYQESDSTPSWYVGHSAFNAAVFTSVMNDFSSSMNSYGASTSSSSGGSSGGGSSGGGGGGGGGGGW